MIFEECNIEEKNMSTFLKGASQRKKCANHWKQYVNAKNFSPVTYYRKYFMFGGGERSMEGEKEKKKNRCLKIFQAWITETLCNLFKTVCEVLNMLDQSF